MPWKVHCLFEIFHGFELVKAHFDAVTLAKVDHHNISVGNIIIVQKSNGPCRLSH